MFIGNQLALANPPADDSPVITMWLPDEEWRLVSDPFEDWRLHQHVTPLIDEPGAGSVLLVIAEDHGKSPTLLACHTMQAFACHLAEIRLMKAGDIVCLGDFELMEQADSEGFLKPPFFGKTVRSNPEILKFLEMHTDEVHYRMKSPLHSIRGVVHSSGLTALRKAIEAVS